MGRVNIERAEIFIYVNYRTVRRVFFYIKVNYFLCKVHFYSLLCGKYLKKKFYCLFFERFWAFFIRIFTMQCNVKTNLKPASLVLQGVNNLLNKLSIRKLDFYAF